MKRDASLDTLLLLDGESFIVEDGFWVKFEVKRVAASATRPHGLDYSLTLHNSANERLLGFDNAHSIREGSGRERGRGLTMTTSTRASGCAFTIIGMRGRCLPIFGRRWS